MLALARPASVDMLSVPILRFALLVAAGSLPCGAAQETAARGTVALVGGTVRVDPSAAPLRDAVVLVVEGEITAVGSRVAVEIPVDAETLDCSGCTITAGFWNCHVHFFERKWADAGALPAVELERELHDVFGRHGFTSVFDLSSAVANTRRIRERIESGEVRGPRILTTGEGIVAPGTLPSAEVFRVMGVMDVPLPEVRDASAAADAAAELLAQGADGIKLFLRAPSPGAPPFPEGGISAVVELAHEAERPVFAHPNAGTDVLAALDAGVDVIAHTTPQTGPWDAELIARAHERGAALTPTLFLWKSFLRHDRRAAREGVVATAVGQLRAWSAAGNTVLFGTDLGAVDDDPTEEYRLMAEAGLDPSALLTALTTAPAARFGAAERLGRVAPGLRADLVVFEGDPAAGVGALAAVRFTLRDGVLLCRPGD